MTRCSALDAAEAQLICARLLAVFVYGHKCECTLTHYLEIIFFYSHQRNVQCTSECFI